MTLPIDPHKLRFGSVCSGIEAASCAWNELGWRAAWFSEIEPFPCELLKQRFPDVPNYGDMTTLPERILSGEVEAPDILCGGTPCQAFSVAGKRLSLADARGNLSLVFCQIADAIDAVRTRLGYPPLSFSGKTFPECFTRKTTLLDASRLNSLVQALPLQQIQDDGRVLVLLQDPKGRLHGERLTHNTTECHNAAVESSLLQVLERTSIPPKYFLSPIACQGILRRAEAKGKKLPELLYKTLLAQAKEPPKEK